MNSVETNKRLKEVVLAMNRLCNQGGTTSDNLVTVEIGLAGLKAKEGMKDSELRFTIQCVKKVTFRLMEEANRVYNKAKSLEDSILHEEGEAWKSEVKRKQEEAEKQMAKVLAMLEGLEAERLIS
jgi:hypothetical protein